MGHFDRFLSTHGKLGLGVVMCACFWQPTVSNNMHTRDATYTKCPLNWHNLTQTIFFSSVLRRTTCWMSFPSRMFIYLMARIVQTSQIHIIVDIYSSSYYTVSKTTAGNKWSDSHYRRYARSKRSYYGRRQSHSPPYYFPLRFFLFASKTMWARFRSSCLNIWHAICARYNDKLLSITEIDTG